MHLFYVPLKMIHLFLPAFTVKEHDSSAVTSFNCYSMMALQKLRVHVRIIHLHLHLNASTTKQYFMVCGYIIL